MIGIAAVLVVVLIAACATMSAGWSMQRRTGKTGWADVFWTFGTGAAGVFVALVPLPHNPGIAGRQVLVATLVALWSLRLGSHIASRTLHGDDDPRYAKLNQDWGADAPRRMFWFLQIQALTIVFLAVAIFAAARSPRPSLDLRDALGGFLLLIAIVGENLADRQLRAFGRASPNKGRVCDIGLWRWSRHPNYFFEWLAWLAYPLIGVSGGYPWGWVTLVAPAMMYWLLVHVSGVPPLEEHMLRSRGDAFRAYQAHTSAFFPWPPSP